MRYFVIFMCIFVISLTGVLLSKFVPESMHFFIGNITGIVALLVGIVVDRELDLS